MENKTVITYSNSSCKQKLRVPSDRGELKIICSKCKIVFIFSSKKDMDKKTEEDSAMLYQNAMNIFNGDQFQKALNLMYLRNS